MKLPVLLIVFLLVSSAVADPPNLVIFISDDLGRWDTSIHGSPDAKTPTMDRLAADGMVFENAYVASPACCPNRYSFLTGLMPAKHGAHPNHSEVKEGTKFLPPMLNSLGYHVTSFGKISHERDGFPGVDHLDPMPRNLSGQYLPYFTQENPEGPICLMIGDRRPHVAWTKESTYDPEKITLPSFFIDTKETREHWARYLSDITGMDAEIGKAYDFAKEKFGDDFIFLFTSDHGGQWPRGKWNLYDYGTRIPLIVVWPGKIEAGARTSAMVSWVDLLPTLIDLAGGEVPGDIDGESFADVLLGKSDSHQDKIFTTHTGDGPMNIFPIRSVRVGSYKYIHNLRPDAYHTNHSDRLRKDGAGAYWNSWDTAAKNDAKAAAIVEQYYTRPEFEFYDLSADPFELNNLYGDPKHENRIGELRSDLSEWTTSQGDDLQPHLEPYPKTEPLPEITPKQKQRGKK